MRWIIKNLEHESNYKTRMLGTTPPTHWKGTQETWDLKEKNMIKDLKTAIKILKKQLNRVEKGNDN